MNSRDDSCKVCISYQSIQSAVIVINLSHQKSLKLSLCQGYSALSSKSFKPMRPRKQTWIVLDALQWVRIECRYKWRRSSIIIETKIKYRHFINSFTHSPWALERWDGGFKKHPIPSYTFHIRKIFYSLLHTWKCTWSIELYHIQEIIIGNVSAKHTPSQFPKICTGRFHMALICNKHQLISYNKLMSTVVLQRAIRDRHYYRQNRSTIRMAGYDWLMIKHQPITTRNLIS